MTSIFWTYPYARAMLAHVAINFLDCELISNFNVASNSSMIGGVSFRENRIWQNWPRIDQMRSVAWIRVEHFAIFAITFKILRILTEHKEKVCSLDSKLFLIYICSMRILNILEVIAKTRFSKKKKTQNAQPLPGHRQRFHLSGLMPLPL